MYVEKRLYLTKFKGWFSALQRDASKTSVGLKYTYFSNKVQITSE